MSSNLGLHMYAQRSTKFYIYDIKYKGDPIESATFLVERSLLRHVGPCARPVHALDALLERVLLVLTLDIMETNNLNHVRFYNCMMPPVEGGRCSDLLEVQALEELEVTVMLLLAGKKSNTEGLAKHIQSVLIFSLSTLIEMVW